MTGLTVMVGLIVGVMLGLTVLPVDWGGGISAFLRVNSHTPKLNSPVNKIPRMVASALLNPSSHVSTGAKSVGKVWVVGGGKLSGMASLSAMMAESYRLSAIVSGFISGEQHDLTRTITPPTLSNQQ